MVLACWDAAGGGVWGGKKACTFMSGLNLWRNGNWRMESSVELDGGMKLSVEWNCGTELELVWNGNGNGIGVGVEWEWGNVCTYLKSVYPISGDHLTVKDF